MLNADDFVLGNSVRREFDDISPSIVVSSPTKNPHFSFSTLASASTMQNHSQKVSALSQWPLNKNLIPYHNNASP